jgi:hypothetical protein
MPVPEHAREQPLPAARPAFGPEILRDCAAIAGVAVLMAAALRPFRDVPFVDDWGYAWSVQHLLEAREFLFPELLLNPIATHVLWGALFCLPFGFSFTALRVSTWVMGVLAVLALYLLIRECGGERRDAAIGAGALGFYPAFPTLAASFMTDVPCLAWMLWSMWLFVRALNRRRAGLVWLAAAACAGSVGCRVIGLGVAAAMIPMLLFHTGRWGRRVSVLAAPALVFPFAAWLFLWTRARVFTSADITWIANSPQQRTANLKYALGGMFPGMLVTAILFAVVLTGIALLPIAAGAVRRANLRRTALAFGLLSGGWLSARWAGLDAWVAFRPEAFWALREIGGTACLVPGWQPEPLSRLAAAGGVIVALGSAATLAAARPRSALREPGTFLVWSLAAQVLIVATLWLFYDRYALVLVPLAAALVLAHHSLSRRWTALLCIALYAVIGLAGARDSLDYNRALWTAVSDLRAAGTPPREIDGGYVVNGWLQYVHPEEAYRDPSGRIIVPMVNDFAELTYVVADRPMPNRSIVRTYPYSGWLRPAGSIYVLKR